MNREHLAAPRRRRRVRSRTTAAALGLTMVVSTALLTAGPGHAEDTTEAPAASLVRVSTPTSAERDLLTSLGLDLTEHGGDDFVDVVLHTAEDAAALAEADLAYDVEVADLGLAWARSNQQTAAWAASIDRSALPSGRMGYRSLADYGADLDRLAAAHPGLVKPLTLPHRTLEGRTVRGIELSAEVDATDGKPVFLLMGLHHAREWPSGEHAMEFAIDLAQGYGNDDRITDLLGRTRVIVVPVVNPDGYEQSFKYGSVLDLREADDGGTVSILGTPGNAYKRKNCRVVDSSDSTPPGACDASSPGGFGLGVDLNRNYGGFWGGPGADAQPAGATYRGAAPFSEPESENIRSLVSSRQVTTLISNHTFSNLVLRPPGLRSAGDTPDEPAYAALGARMAAQNGYVNQKSYELYDTTGTTEDWSYYATGGLGFTFEIGEEFHPPYNRVVDHYLGDGEYAGKGNREAYRLALESTADTALHSVISGKAPEGATLHLEKSFATVTSPVVSTTGSTGEPVAFEDRLTSTLRVPSGGRYAWHVNPSTRPIMQERRLATLSAEPTRTETFTGTAPTPVVGSVDVEFTMTESDQALLQVDLGWPTPDDMDLEVYYRDADGSLSPVASSGNFLEKETAYIDAPRPGTYVLRVINFASVSPTYELRAALYAAGPDQVVGGLVENWTLSCAGPDGTVHERVPVVVDRGQQVKVDLKECSRALAGR